MSTSFESFEFFEGARTDNRAPKITVRRSGQLSLTGAAVALLGEGVAHVQLGYDTVTKAVGIRSAPEGAKGRYKLRQQANRSALLDGRRFFAHHGLSLIEPRTFDAEAFGQGIVGFRLVEQREAPQTEGGPVEAKPATGGKRKTAA
ncbi:MAG TPA: hypothetical protein VF017_04630 [Thermoanaerobaculia bacterium]|nr:hypothetical protein [Thermoanaerobaculia bacterium]